MVLTTEEAEEIQGKGSTLSFTLGIVVLAQDSQMKNVILFLPIFKA